MTDPYIEAYLRETAEIATLLDQAAIARMVGILAEVKSGGGRLFCLGVGGSAANASHAVADFNKLAGMNAFSPVDNVAELTARINDDGWERSYADWLTHMRLSPADAVLVLSVGGGDAERVISVNIVRALDCARRVGARIIGIVGRDGGYTARVADACVIVPTVNPERITAHAEAFQGVLWHALAMHPRLLQIRPKWESSV